MNLTPEQINTAIAEWHLGYQYRMEGERYPSEQDWQKYPAVYTADGGFIGLHKPDWPIGPNYHGDLNACRDALLKLSKEQSGLYPHHLEALTHSGKHYTDYYTFNGSIAFATAPQICEALLRTIGKWPIA